MTEATQIATTVWQELQSHQLEFFQHLGGWTYVLLALLVTVEGPIATLLGAGAATTGALELKFVFLAAMVGNLLADVLWYTLGYFGRLEWVVHYGGWIGVRERQVQTLHTVMSRHVRKILLIAKLTLSLVIPALMAAGLARVSWRRWFPVIFLAETMWTGALVLLGFYATESIRQVERGIHQFAILTSVGLVVILIVVGLRRYLQIPQVEDIGERESKTDNF